jgi:phosphoglucosamine mutase
LVNVAVPKPERLADCSEVWSAVARAEAELGDEGRVLLRPSGTQPLVRIMVEARRDAQATEVAAQLAGVVESALGSAAGPISSPSPAERPR